MRTSRTRVTAARTVAQRYTARFLLAAAVLVTWITVTPGRAAADLASAAAGRDYAREVPPETAGFSAERFALVDAAIERAVADSASPGVALVVGRYGKIVRQRGYGRTSWHPFAPAVTDSTLYDLASLTKAMATSTLAMQLVREGRLDLDRPIHNYLRSWPGWGAYGRITSRHLLAHTSGLPAGSDMWPGVRTRQERIAALARLRVRTTPGARREYSDVGMILLGAVLEEITDSRLDDLLYMRVLQPLAMADTRFNPLLPGPEKGPFALAQIAPTELDTYVRKALVHGVVHDLNAWSMEGVAGHAGLFSSARDMALYGQMLLDAANGRETPVFPAGAFLAWMQRERAFGRPLGWDIPTGPNSAAGSYFGGSSFGHTGFTGTSIWVDPDHDLFVVLLTNRLNPSARNRKHIQLRRDVHDLVQLAIADARVVRRE
jgi:CubicO group peptidase (beta-lactamase class C family)